MKQKQISPHEIAQERERERHPFLIRVDPLVANHTLAFKTRLSSRDRLTHMLRRKLTLQEKVDSTGKRYMQWSGREGKRQKKKKNILNLISTQRDWNL